MIRLLIKEIKTHKAIYCTLLVIFLAGLFLRTYRLNEILGFWFDQGRDATAITDIIYKYKFTLIGPTTGFEGIFRGPFYYYYLLPGYLIGNGNPIVASVYLSTLNSLGIVVLYVVGAIFFSRRVGLLASAIMSFSYIMVSFDRWLSHPPILSLFAPITFGLFLGAFTYKQYLLMPAMFFLGLTLQLEEAGMIFVTISLIIFILLQKKFKLRILFYSALAFFSTFLPLILFNLRHEFIMINNIIKVLSGSSDKQAVFGFPSVVSITEALSFYTSTLGSTLFFNVSWKSTIPIIGLSLFFIFVCFIAKKHLTNIKFKLMLVWIFSPAVFLIFYQDHNLYNYYLAGVMPIFILFIAYLLVKISRPYQIIAYLLFLILFAFFNLPYIYGSLTHQIEGTGTIAIKNQLQTLNYIVKNSEDSPIVLESYVPPQIPHAYIYLSSWYEKSGKLKLTQDKNQANLLFTIIEFDSQHPNLRQSFIDRANNESTILEETQYGGIIVQKRLLNKP